MMRGCTTDGGRGRGTRVMKGVVGLQGMKVSAKDMGRGGGVTRGIGSDVIVGERKGTGSTVERRDGGWRMTAGRVRSGAVGVKSMRRWRRRRGGACWVSMKLMRGVTNGVVSVKRLQLAGSSTRFPPLLT
jgi:hypothetical protein